jgi:uncharacterized protein YktA (UPF0223 family)
MAINSVPSIKSDVESTLASKYDDANTWVEFGRSLIWTLDAEYENALAQNTTWDDLARLRDSLDLLESYLPPTSFVYTSPDRPTFTDVPAYSSPTMGTILAIPEVLDVTIPDAPDSAIVFTNSEFSDSLIDVTRSKLETTGTGLGDSEAGIFARETARQNDARAKAYTEITTSFSSRGFDLPPGALLAKQTEINNESNIRLADASTAIMAESAKLAQAWNQTTVTGSVQFLDILARVFDSKVMRDFEAAKTSVMMAFEGFKQVVLAATTKAQLNATAITATTSANEGTVKAFVAQVEGQVAPIKAIAEANKAVAEAYDAEVKGEASSLQAQMLPEELKLKGHDLNVRIAGMKADVISKEVALGIDIAMKQLQFTGSILAAKTEAAKQIIASALNSVNASVSMSIGGSSSESEDINRTNQDVFKSQNISV